MITGVTGWCVLLLFIPKTSLPACSYVVLVLLVAGLLLQQKSSKSARVIGAPYPMTNLLTACLLAGGTTSKNLPTCLFVCVLNFLLRAGLILGVWHSSKHENIKSNLLHINTCIDRGHYPSQYSQSIVGAHLLADKALVFTGSAGNLCFLYIVY